jgi:Mg-chelatase subunit ChlD
MQEAYCNDFPCPSDLVCTAQLDMLVLLDGSGSVNWYGPGFEQERSFTKKLFELMSFGETGAKAGVILFSWEAELISPMTVDQQALLDAVEGMVWPHWSTDTAAALTMAKYELTNSGRPEVPKESTIVFLLTDGNANSMWSTRKAATDL